MLKPVLTAVALFTGLVRALALGPDEGYRNIPWGASESNLVKVAEGQMVSNRYMHLPDFKNSGEQVMLGGVELITNRTKKLVFLEKYNQRSEYILCDDRLVAVLNRPATHLTMDPITVIEQVREIAGDREPVVRKDLALPTLWGRLVQTESLHTFEWDSPGAIIRIPCRTWPIDDYRQVFFVVHVSKAQMKRNLERIEEIRKEEEEARRKAEEEAKRKAEEDARAKAVEAARTLPPGP